MLLHSWSSHGYILRSFSFCARLAQRHWPCASSLIRIRLQRPPLYYTIKALRKQPAAPLCFCISCSAASYAGTGTFRQEVRHAAELFEKCGAAHRFRRGAAAGRHGPAHLAGKRAGRRGDGPLPTGAGGVFAVRHAGNGGRFGGGYPAHGRGTQRPGFRPWCNPRHAAPSAGGRTCAGAVCRCTAAGDSGSCGPVVAWRCPRRWCFTRFSAGNAMDGGLGGAAGLFHRPAACSSQCVQPAYGADGAHRAGGTGAYPYRGPCGGRALYAGAGSYRRQRSGVGAVHAGLLPAGCPQCLCGAKSRPPGRPGPPSVGDPVAGGGRAGAPPRWSSTEN